MVCNKSFLLIELLVSIAIMLVSVAIMLRLYVHTTRLAQTCVERLVAIAHATHCVERIKGGRALKNKDTVVVIKQFSVETTVDGVNHKMSVAQVGIKGGSAQLVTVCL